MKYVIGIDFGTLSARGVLLCGSDGEVVANADSQYRHGVMDRALPSGRALPVDFALQHPMDYLESLGAVVGELVSKSGVATEDIVGIGIDFTSSTVIAVDERGEPLCTHPEFVDEPHAYVKLWKHHGAQAEADEITDVAMKRGESWLPDYGRKISCELALPKIIETARRAPRVYAATYNFMDAGDWLTERLVGKEVSSVSFAGYKFFWNEKRGYPCNEFIKEIEPSADGLFENKLVHEVLPVGKCAGIISPEGARLSGLSEGTAVALPLIDAHAPIPALNMTRSGDIVMILGTSGCYILNSEIGNSVPGMCGYAKDTVIPGLYTYEAGQPSVGDTLDWFVKNCVPKSYYDEAEKRGIGIHTLLTEKAARLLPGESGLISLDWFNGNRSTLVDFDLSGMILGLTLQTRPEEIYRALIEGIAFGSRVIFEQYEKYGVPVSRVMAAGGIATKNPMMIEIYADVLGREINVSLAEQSGARGSAIYAAVAAGLFSSVTAAADAYDRADFITYKPTAAKDTYNELYSLYLELHDRFGLECELMKKIKKIKTDQKDKRR